MTKSTTDEHRSTVAQSVIIGSGAGAFEVGVNHPLWTIKKDLQCGKPINLAPSNLYCGIWGNAASMIPITAIQVAANRFFQNVFYKNVSEPNYTQRLFLAFMAGAASSLASCPAEMVMIHQSKLKAGFIATGGQLYAQGGLSRVYTALTTTSLREALFTGSYLGLAPMLKEKMKPHCDNEVVVSLGAGIAAGVAATVTSQGVDTVKTIQQASDTPLSAIKAGQSLYAKDGWMGFFKGGLARGTRVVSAIVIISTVTDRMDRFFRERNRDSSMEAEASRSLAPS